MEAVIHLISSSCVFMCWSLPNHIAAYLRDLNIGMARLVRTRGPLHGTHSDGEWWWSIWEGLINTCIDGGDLSHFSTVWSVQGVLPIQTGSGGEGLDLINSLKNDMHLGNGVAT